jgi:hypothetical protein
LRGRARCHPVLPAIQSMAQSAVWHTPNAHHPDLWLDANYTLEPKTLDQTQEYQAAFDAWLNAVPNELEFSSTCTDQVTLSPSDDVFSPTPDLSLSPSPIVGSLLYDQSIINATHHISGIEVRSSEFQATPRRAKLSTSSWDTDCSQDESSQRLACSECARTFENLSALNKHTQSTLHKAWRCFEAGCEKSYARRDTFLRHRVAHRDDALSHICLVCLQVNKRKTFKRKDHLRDHMRNCHSKGSGSRRSVFVISALSVQKC